MNRHEHDRIYEAVSAYLDGEADGDARIARLIQTDPDYARVHRELSGLSERVKRLKAPEVHPAFRTRVLASIEEQKRAPRRRWIAYVLPAAAACAVLLAASVWLLSGTGPGSDTAAPHTAELPRWLEYGAEPLDSELERRVALADSGAVDALLHYYGLGEFSEEDEYLSIPAEVLIEDEVTYTWLDAMALTLPVDDDVHPLLDTLDAEEASVFRELLMLYALDEEWQS
jgi:hypothetical protein